jgi:hypothetical protein
MIYKIEKKLEINELLKKLLYVTVSRVGGLVVSMLASGTQYRGFEPGRSRRIFRVKKSTACLPSDGQ